MILRQARIGDAAEICAILNTAVRGTLSTFTAKEVSEAEIAADIALRWAAFLVAEHDGQIVGYATFGPFRVGNGYAHTKELSIHLAQSARGQGQGKALMRRLEIVAKQQDVHVLVAGISGANPDAQAFHAACGFVEVGRMDQVGFKAGKWLDLVLMQKTLSKADTGRITG